MIGLSVAVARFVEALFWAIFRVAGTVAMAVVLGLAVLALVGVFARRWVRHRRRR
ncbi:hypothetical protein Q5H91_13820 [Sphingomonas sp. KR1UV-12]|uniref:Uncharacterized protein n=1 Tax=Sphingomonas aurea TaxID=3063994 RepID=A0ABT9ENR5_9SPHN|nr:hypothetical protein [Sphingomonas sp. KR1UV-12]MDP1028298.1 hypothetical protein [Sphingomonas sp. KR1UV-12]